MKKLLSVLIFAVFLFGCASPGNVAEHERFTLELPEGWRRVDNSGVVSYAQNGDPVHSSTISFYATEKNYYFDDFTRDDYSDHANDYSGYEQITVTDFENLNIDGWNAHKITFSAMADQATLTIIMYAVDADMTYYFTLLQMEGESYADFFDKSISSVKIHTKG